MFRPATCRCVARCLIASGVSWAACAEIPARALVVEEPAAQQASSPNALATAKSDTFRVSGGDAAIRSAIIMLAEAASTEFRETCDIKSDWTIPIEIRLPGKASETRPVLTGLLDVEGVRRFLLDVHMVRGIDHEPFKRALYALFMYEQAIRRGVDPDEQLSAMPWIVDGLLEAAAWRKGESDRRFYRTLFLSGGLFRLSDLLTMDEDAYGRLDGASRLAFRVSSGALIMALLQQAQGKEAFRAFLGEATSHGGEMRVLLSRHFPDLNLSETGLEKLWRLQMAEKGGMNPLQDVLSIRETERMLEDALQLDFRTEEGIVKKAPLSDWPRLSAMAQEERRMATRLAEDALVRLSFRCFPSYRPILREYQILLASLRGKAVGDPRKKLSELLETRQVMMARADHGRDYLDWFEITRARETSGAFEDYKKLKERLRNKPNSRTSSTALYLDRMDKMFSRN